MTMYAPAYGPSAYGMQPGWNAATSYPGATAGALVPYNPNTYGTGSPTSALGLYDGFNMGYASNRRPWAYGRVRSTIEFNDWDSNNPFWLLSNSAPLPLYDEQGRFHPTAAHLFHARKFLDPRLADQVSACSTAQGAKELADSWRPYIRPDWRRVNVQMNYADAPVQMEWVIREKLRQNPQFAQLLMSTGRCYLLNTSIDENFWGIGSGRGRNELGRALMRLRKEL
ncbi:hypothetical protein DACRYDRAFT_105168 [Dacryopinax primogenitus]|uniref:NADAR domain-containing protein n=1 Tax=Dacryopinax primogenitus (strain DJM 731) TaxID=1858805 RepID=M5G7D4_DACPD|nr:uncharacterized protein DACRYDRAFT_105168 [Dacryopinax primogenitus]EJU04100.1 hypothetical protein DACRYDRAFT_105168 [Dacryopinax primogenitus]